MSYRDFLGIYPIGKDQERLKPHLALSVQRRAGDLLLPSSPCLIPLFSPYL